MTKDKIEKLLSPKELELLEREARGESKQMIATGMHNTASTRRTLRQRIQKKTKMTTKDIIANVDGFRPGAELVPLPPPLAQTPQNCDNCLRYKSKIHNNGIQTIICQIHGQITYNSNEPYICQDYKTSIERKFQEKDLLEERLKDSGFLKMMFNRYALGNEPGNSKDMLKLGVNQAGCQDYLFRKRAQQLLTIIQSARYPVVVLTKEDLHKYAFIEEYLDEETLKIKKRTRYPIREFLEHHRIKLLKTEYEDEDNKEYTSYFVFKNPRLYQQLMTALFQETEISIPEEETLQVTFEKDVFLVNAYLEREGQKEQIEIDLKRPSKIHTMAAICTPGEYNLILVIGESKNYSFNLIYELNIEENNNCSFKQIA